MATELRTRTLCVSASLIVLSVILSFVDVAAQTSIASSAFVADVVVERVVLDSRGNLLHQMPKMRYRLTVGSDGERTEIAFQNTPPFPGKGPLKDQSAGYRVEVSTSDGVRAFDKDGNQSGTFPVGALPIPAGRGQQVFVPHSRRLDRKSLLVAQFGAALGKVRSHDRYVRTVEGLTHEVLVEPENAVTMEVRAIRAGRVESLTTYAYANLKEGWLYCRERRDETSRPANGQRLVSTTTYVPVIGAGQ